MKIYQSQQSTCSKMPFSGNVQNREVHRDTEVPGPPSWAQDPKQVAGGDLGKSLGRRQIRPQCPDTLCSDENQPQTCQLVQVLEERGPSGMRRPGSRQGHLALAGAEVSGWQGRKIPEKVGGHLPISSEGEGARGRRDRRPRLVMGGAGWAGPS